MMFGEAEKASLWGIALIFVLALNCGSAEETTKPQLTENVVLDKAGNETFSYTVTANPAEQQSSNGSEIDDVSQIAERRISLMDFFFGNKNGNSNSNVRTEIHTPELVPGQQQVHVQQQPNQMMVVRESNFPNPNGGLLSRLILARRMSRLQRLSNRLQILPAMLGLFQRQEQQIPQQQTLHQRIGPQYPGDSYNPADILLEGIGFKNASVSPHRQYSRVQIPNYADDFPFERSREFGQNTDSSYFGVSNAPNQAYPQAQSSVNDHGVQAGNYGYRKNLPSQEPRQKQNIHNQQQPFYYQQQQYRQQPTPQDQDSPLPQQQSAYDQQQQLIQQQQVFEQQEQLRHQQQQQLYDQQQQQLKQQQLYDQQQLLKQQEELYGNKQLQLQQEQSEAGNLNQQGKQQSRDQQQLKLQQDIYEEQKQLKQLILDQQEQLKTQDERVQQLHQELLQNKNQQGLPKPDTQQSRDSAIPGSSGILDYGSGANLGPGAFQLGADIGADPFKAGGGGQHYNPGIHGDGNIGLGPGLQDKTSYQQPIVIVQKPAPVDPPALKLPLFPLGLLPRPLLNLNGKVFFGAELGKEGGLTTGGWK